MSGEGYCQGVPPRAPQMSLGSLIEVECREKKLTYQALSTLTGVSAPSLYRFEKKGAVPTTPSYKRLKAYFGDRLGPMKTETDRRRSKARENLVVLNGVPPEVRSERARRAGQAGRGGHKPNRAAALRREYETGMRVRPLAKDVPDVTTKQGRARVSLGKYLRGDPFPTPEVQRRWAAAVSDRIGLSEDEVMAAWRPKLRRWGLIKEGRPTNETRHVLVECLRAEWALAHRSFNGFWRYAARRVREEEGTAMDLVSLRSWWTHHLSHCDRNKSSKAKAVARRRERHEAEIATVAKGQVRGVRATMGPGDAAKALGVSRATIRRLMEDGTLRPVQVSAGGWRRYSASDVAALARARAGGTAETA